MPAPILNIADLQFMPWGRGERFEARLGPIGERIGAQKLGYNLTVLPPGKCAFPFHSHYVNEEMFFVLEGEGELRIGAERYPLRAGDVVACPPGGPQTAHQIRNTSVTAELRFLAVSTRITPEVAEYPDSGKVGVLGSFPDAAGKLVQRRFMTRCEATMDDYWEGE